MRVMMRKRLMHNFLKVGLMFVSFGEQSEFVDLVCSVVMSCDIEENWFNRAR